MMDQEGPYLLCSSEQAQKHYDAALEALIDGGIHALNAGTTIIIVPPLGILEGYKAVKSIKDLEEFLHE